MNSTKTTAWEVAEPIADKLFKAYAKYAEACNVPTKWDPYRAAIRWARRNKRNMRIVVDWILANRIPASETRSVPTRYAFPDEQHDVMEFIEDLQKTVNEKLMRQVGASETFCGVLVAYTSNLVKD